MVTILLDQGSPRKWAERMRIAASTLSDLIQIILAQEVSHRPHRLLCCLTAVRAAELPLLHPVRGGFAYRESSTAQHLARLCPLVMQSVSMMHTVPEEYNPQCNTSIVYLV